MKRIVATEAICLRTRNWHESSRIVNLLTPDLGMIAAIARGARRPKGYRAAALDLFAHARITIYLPIRGELHNIGDAELLNAHRGLVQDYERFRTAGLMARFLLRTLRRPHPEPNIFSLLTRNLQLLAESPVVPADCSALLAGFLLKATAFLGFRPNLNTCVHCHRQIKNNNSPPITTIRFSIAHGGFLCTRCLPEEKTWLTHRELQTLNQLIYTPSAELLNLTISSETKRFINHYIGHHFNIPDPQFL